MPFGTIQPPSMAVAQKPAPAAASKADRSKGEWKMPTKEQLAKELAVLEHYFRDPVRKYQTPTGLATNVIGIGIGNKIKTENGKEVEKTDDLCVRFHVDW